jgi:hypothetical protein
LKFSNPVFEKEGVQLALADHSAYLPEGEERDQCDSEDDSNKEHSAQTSATDNGDALGNRLAFEYSDKHLFNNVQH